MLCYENLVKRLKKLGSLRITVSFHFPNARLYKKYCQTDGFSQAVQGIKNLIEYNIKFGVNMVVMKPNIQYLEKMVRLLRDMGFKDKITLNFVVGKELPKKDYRKIVPKFTECRKIVEKITTKNIKQTTINGIPPCIFSKKIRKNIVGCFERGKETFIMSATSVPSEKFFSISEEKKKKYFMHVKVCKMCILKSECAGIRKEYYRYYGDKEIKPIAEYERA
jgi:MoaA/NifB/PqqE/SkfB family radical SAM enzyme